MLHTLGGRVWFGSRLSSCGLFELIVHEHKLLLDLFPCLRLEEKVGAALIVGGLLRRLDARLLGEPELELFVVAPVVLVELVCGGFLEDIFGLGVKDVEEGLFVQLTNLGSRAGGMHVVAGGQGELWLDLHVG